MYRDLAHALAALALLALPFAQADHLRASTTYQSSNDDLEVTIRFDYAPSGNCCGGLFSFAAGDGRTSGSIPDGLASGTYAGDAAGSGTFSDGSAYNWARSRIVAGSDALLRIEVAYTYEEAGAYLASGPGGSFLV